MLVVVFTENTASKVVPIRDLSAGGSDCPGNDKL